MNRSNLFRGFACTALVMLSACQLNVFDPLDSPSEDPQLRSAARACLDRGDLECARDLYGKLSNESSSVKESELAFTTLDENGASMGAFMEAFGDGAGGKGFTKLANLLKNGSGAVKRTSLFTAWQRTLNLTNYPELRGIVRFASAAALAAETLAEIRSLGGDNDKFTSDDLVSSPSGCKALSATTCNSTLCDPPSNSFLVSGSALGSLGFDASGALGYSTHPNPHLAFIDGAITEIAQALSSSELGASGRFGAGTGTFATAIQSSSVAFSADATTNHRCYRWLLVSNGIGEE